MTTISLSNNNLSDADVSQLNIAVQSKGASLKAETNQWISPNKVAYHRLSKCTALFDPSKGSEVEIEAIFRSYDFQRTDVT